MSDRHALAVRTDGTLWAWGRNGNASYGPLGLGDNNHRSSPTQVGTLTTWSQVATAASHSLAIKTDGTMWVWGLGNQGHLGTGNLVSTKSPVQVGTLTTWSTVVTTKGTSSLVLRSP